MDWRLSVEVKKRKKRDRLGCESPERLFMGFSDVTINEKILAIKQRSDTIPFSTVE